MRPEKLTAESINRIHDTMKSCLIAKKQYEVVIRLHDGSLKARQRALCKIWYKDAAEAQGFSVGYCEAVCKYSFGFAIACEDKPELRDMFYRMIDGRTYPERIEIIETFPELFPILRDDNGMTSEQIGRYLREIQQSFAEQGIILTSPKEQDLLNYPESQRR